jgi:hypothetical protein
MFIWHAYDRNSDERRGERAAHTDIDSDSVDDRSDGGDFDPEVGTGRKTREEQHAPGAVSNSLTLPHDNLFLGISVIRITFIRQRALATPKARVKPPVRSLMPPTIAGAVAASM